LRPAWRLPAGRAAAPPAGRQRLDTEALRDCRDQRDPGVRDDPLVIERDPHTIQSDRPVILHHEGDLLTRAPTARTVVKALLRLRRSFFLADRTEPAYETVDPG